MAGKMLRVKPSYFSETDEHLRKVFYDTYFAPLLDLIPKQLNNASPSPLVAAINKGKIKYTQGVFSGTYNVAISRELSRFATFDKRSGTWRVIFHAPAEVLAASLKAEGHRKALVDKINKQIDAMGKQVDETIKTLSFGIDLPLFAMNNDIAETFPVGIRPTLDARTAEKLRRDYNDSQKLNVKNWNPEQITRLRDMVERYQTSESDESLTDMIMSEWGVTANKAEFLARQETSLFFSKFSMNRASSAGVRKYRWSTSHDIRVRPEHKELQGTIHLVDDPPIVDAKTGRRGHPGEDYGCRCSPIWVLD
jgi:SPP1 gp7 family putative phage head morphogenesis protein